MTIEVESLKIGMPAVRAQQILSELDNLERTNVLDYTMYPALMGVQFEIRTFFKKKEFFLGRQGR